MGGFFSFIAAVFGKGVGGYAALLVFSLATITGSMFVLSGRQADGVIFANVRYDNSAISSGSPADFRPDSQVRTVIVNFEGGLATGLREAVTNLAGSIRAVSSNIIAEAQREDAARAAAQVSRASAFGLSADSQLAAQAPALTVPRPTGPQATLGPVVPTAPPATGGQAPPAPTTAPPAPQSMTAPTQAAVQPAVIPPAQAPSQPTAVPATPIPPTATPLPVPTATPAPSQPQQQTQPEATSAPSQPEATSAPVAATIQPEPTTPPVVATVLAAVPTAVPTAVPVATLVPTRVASVATFVPAQLSLIPGTLQQPIFSFSGNLPGGQPITRDVTLFNEGAYDFTYFLTAEAGTGPLWTDTVNGLQARVTVDGVERYSGALSLLTNDYMGLLLRGETQVMNITVSLPGSVPNAYQGETMSAVFKFSVVCAQAC